MSNKVLGGGFLSGSLGESPDFSEISAPLNRILTGVLSSGYLQNWIVQEEMGDGAQLLANGYYANRIPLSDLDLNVIRDDISQTQNNLDQSILLSNTTLLIADGSALSADQVNEIQATQSNPLPLAASVPANTMLKITVPETYKDITTTHLASGSDTTTDSSGTLPSVDDPVAGFIFNWPNGGTLFITSNGVDNWRF